MNNRQIIPNILLKYWEENAPIINGKKVPVTVYQKRIYTLLKINNVIDKDGMIKELVA